MARGGVPDRRLFHRRMAWGRDLGRTVADACGVGWLYRPVGGPLDGDVPRPQPLAIRRPPLGGPSPSDARLRIGSAGQRLPVPVRELSITDGHVHLEAEWAHTILRLEGDLRSESTDDAGVMEGTLQILRGTSVLTEGTWRLEKYTPAPEDPKDVLQHMRNATGPSGIWDTTWIQDDESADAAPDVAADASSRDHTTHAYGPGGEVAVSSGGRTSFLFAQDRVWTVRPPIGRANPDRRLGEKLLLPEWIRGMEYLRHPDRFTFESWSDRDGHLILLLWTKSPGLVPVRLQIDRTRWMPERAWIEWDAGSRIIDFADYGPPDAGADGSAAAAVMPHSITETYRGRSTSLRVAAAQHADDGMASAGSTRAPLAEGARDMADPFAIPAQPWGVSFEPGDARLPGQLGAGGDGHLFVRPRVNGRDLGWFHVDSGAPFVILDTKLADDLGLEPLREMGDGTLRQVDELRVGQLVLRDLPIWARDLSTASAPEGETRAGVLGGPIFDSAIVEFDYPGHELAVFDPATYTTARSWQPMGLGPGPVVEVKFPGGSGEFILDTGKSGAVSFLSEAARARDLLAGRELTESPNLTVQGESLELSTTLPWMELGGRRVENPVIAVKLPGTPNDDVLGVEGFVGRGLFGDRVLIFDYARTRIAFANH
ncbi:MAG: pepsin/retropepsin-like aspartic protease family protein [Candidatus Eisenbacteria bacterium]